MLGKRIINTATGAACTTDTVQVLGDTSCIAYYKMSDATDETGSYDGTPTNVNFNVAGKFGNAGEFNGSSSYVLAPSFMPTGSNPRSASAWVKTTVSNANMTILFYGSESSNNAFIFRVINGQLGVAFWANDHDFTATGLTDGNWHHVVATYDGSLAKLYLDGNLIGTGSAGAVSTSSANLAIGAYNNGVDALFNGSIDQVRIFNRAITATEVETLYNEVQCIPTIVPTDNFNPVLYTGNGSTQSITSLDFQPDLVWIKERTSTSSHALFDSVRGVNKVLASDTTAAEDGSNPNLLTSFNSDGFSLGNNNRTNQSGVDMVAWNFKAGGADVLNQEGTIDSQVSANVDAGFSIVKYTGTGSNVSVGHGLSSAPEFVIVKSRGSSSNWWVYTTIIDGSLDYLSLNNTSAAGNASQNLPTSQVIYQNNTDSSIAYCFHSVDGYSKIGSYTGGTANQVITTGFRPRFILIKGVDSATADHWVIYDTVRSPINPMDELLLPNLSDAENVNNTNHQINSLSNGFQLITTSTQTNASGGDYIFMAIAEEVFNPNGVTRNDTDPFGDASELALYKFEDNANDAEGSYNGTASNVTYATGYIDKAAVFNGSSSYIQATTGNNDIITSSSYTVSVWITQNTNDTQYRTFFGQQASNGKGIYIGKENTGTTFRCVGNTTNKITLSTNYSHLVVVADSLTNTVKWYLNGALVDSTSGLVFNPSTAAINGTGVRIGQQIGTTFAEFWNGNLDQVRIFDRALDSGEVTQLYNE